MRELQGGIPTYGRVTIVSIESTHGIFDFGDRKVTVLSHPLDFSYPSRLRGQKFLCRKIYRRAFGKNSSDLLHCAVSIRIALGISPYIHYQGEFIHLSHFTPALGIQFLLTKRPNRNQS